MQKQQLNPKSTFYRYFTTLYAIQHRNQNDKLIYIFGDISTDFSIIYLNLTFPVNGAVYIQMLFLHYRHLDIFPTTDITICCKMLGSLSHVQHFIVVYSVDLKHSSSLCATDISVSDKERLYNKKLSCISIDDSMYSLYDLLLYIQICALQTLSLHSCCYRASMTDLHTIALICFFKLCYQTSRIVIFEAEGINGQSPVRQYRILSLIKLHYCTCVC